MDNLNPYARTKVSEARSELIWTNPFYGSLAMRLTIIQDETLWSKTIATDGISLIFVAAFVLSLTTPELLGVMAHEIMHIANGHHLRRGSRHPIIWNLACDYAINPLLLAAGFRLPKDRLESSKYYGWSAEEIYDDLAAHVIVVELPDWGHVIDQTNADGSPLSATERQAAEAQLHMDVLDAARAADRAGKSNDVIRQLAQEAREGGFNWKQVLRQFVSRNGPITSHTWRRPSRRGIGVGMYLPSAVREQCPPIGCIIDSSGSVNQKVLGMFLGEMRAISDEANPEELNVGVGGTHLSTIFAMNRYDPIPPIKGSGGTRLQFMVTQFAELYPQTRMLVVLTDLLDSGMNKAPDFPVMWLVYGKTWRNRVAHHPTYGEIVPMGMTE